MTVTLTVHYQIEFVYILHVHSYEYRNKSKTQINGLDINGSKKSLKCRYSIYKYKQGFKMVFIIYLVLCQVFNTILSNRKRHSQSSMHK